MPLDDDDRRRTIRSFVMRAGRMTVAQQRALDTLWGRWGVEPGDHAVDLDALFGRCAPRVLEIGFGNGDHLARLAARHPEHDFIGIEVHTPGVGHLLHQVAAAGLTNVRLGFSAAVQTRLRPCSFAT